MYDSGSNGSVFVSGVSSALSFSCTGSLSLGASGLFSSFFEGASVLALSLFLSSVSFLGDSADAGTIGFFGSSRLMRIGWKVAASSEMSISSSVFFPSRPLFRVWLCISPSLSLPRSTESAVRAAGEYVSEFHVVWCYIALTNGSSSYGHGAKRRP